MRQYFDITFYLCLVAVLAIFLVQEWPRDANSSATVTESHSTVHGSVVGVGYAAIIWIALPIIGFIIVNVSASRRFKNRLKRFAADKDLPTTTVPIVTAKVPPAQEALRE